MSDTKETAPEKKGGKMKLMMIALGGLVLAGGGVGGGLYAAGMFGGGHGEAKPDRPHLVPRSEQKMAGEGGEGDHGGGSESGGGEHGDAEGGEFASNYYALEKEFTSNLRDSVHFVQVGVAVSTPYDDKVIANMKTHEIAVRSAILMALGETDEEQVFTSEGKEQLQKRLVAAINKTLKEKAGFGGIGNVYFTNFVVQ